MFDYDSFAKWVDGVLQQEFPENTVAVNFNLYEEQNENEYSVQIIGAENFDEEDWACYETFTTGENLYVWVEDGGWEKALRTAVSNLQRYLDSGKYSSVLKKYDGVGIGFVDGDIEIIYKR